MRSWRNWQTHQLEGLAVAIPWWFESTRPHQIFSNRNNPHDPLFLYVAALFLALTGFQLPGWRGFFLSWLALVWSANIYMSLFGRLRLDIAHERLEIEDTQEEAQSPAKAKTSADA